MSIKPTALLFITFVLYGHAVLAQPLITAPDPDRPLAAKWQWALEQAIGAADDTRWVAYQFSTVLDEKISPYLNASSKYLNEFGNRRGDDRLSYHIQQGVWPRHEQGFSTSALLAGNKQRQQEHMRAQELILLARLQGQTLVEIRVVDAYAPIDWRQRPVYWLGTASTGESFRLLGAELDTQNSRFLNEVILRTLGLHAEVNAFDFLYSLYNNPEWSALRPAILVSLSLQRSANSELVLLNTANDENAPLLERRLAIAALHRFNSPTVLAALTKLAAPLNPLSIREAAIASLPDFSAPIVTQTLNEIVWTDSDTDLVLRAVSNLGAMRTTTAQNLLLNIAREHPNAPTRKIALKQLERALL